MTLQFGYCTNVHAGADLEQTQTNLQRYAVSVKERLSPGSPIGIGLWLSAKTARKLLQEDKLSEFAGWLHNAGLLPFTLNGFPFGDFHQRVVKHQVYLPTWLEPARADYTRDLFAILDGLLPEGMQASISTLPLAWGQPAFTDAQFRQVAAVLRELAAELARLEQERGRRITLCLEPEPGCVLQRSTDVVSFFQSYLFGGPDENIVRRYLGVCHDICHAVVMFEEQADVLERYRAAGVTVGKMQVSSAVVLSGERLSSEERSKAIQQLSGFNEDRYLHQTMVRLSRQSSPSFYEDLKPALQAGDGAAAGEWRVHFHVPIYLQRFGRLEASQQAIHECLRLAASQKITDHFEIETYAWEVLPAELQQPDLAAGIAQELDWFQQTWKSLGA